jgi:hypothetical protein
MLMLYLFKVEVFDVGLNYSYSANSLIIADTHEDRSKLLRFQFGDHNESVVKRSVLLGARALTCAEVHLLESTIGTSANLWQITRRTDPRARQVRHLPRLQNEGEMYELMERAPERYDGYPLMTDQYVHSTHFSRRGSDTARLLAVA